MNRLTTIHIASGVVRAGMAVFVVGLLAGCGLIGHYFWVTPFAVCSASLATERVTEVWPWALPLLAIEGFALSLAALGLCVLVRTNGAITLHPPTQERSIS
jgi:hypothetical protein